VKTIVLPCLILAFFILSGSLNSKAQIWKTYPYHQAGSDIYFPDDEGWHPSEETEWWYTVAHLTGDSTGTEYTYMLTYFYHPAYTFDGFRIFNLSNETTGEFYNETLPCNYIILAQDSLNILADIFGGSIEEWINLQDTNGFVLPFQYHLSAFSQNGSINVNYNTVKRPLMVGGTGFLYQGFANYTYYYSQTMIEVSGILTFNSITEPVTGTAWIDRQYGEFNQYGGESYEWFCIQLSNGMDLNLWNIFNGQNQIPDTSLYRLCSIYINDSTDLTTSDFELTRLKYSFMPDSAMCYAQQWNFSYDSINLIITTKHTNNEVTLPFRFYEGSTIIEGIVNGDSVTGIGFAELLHSYVNPDILFVSPDSHQVWNDTKPVIWQLLDHDDGRPVFYDLEFSIDDKLTFNKIAQGLSDTSYLWDPSGITPGTECWLRVIGYSVDSTLVGITETDTTIVIGPAGINDTDLSTSVFFVYPNPFNTMCYISAPADAIIEIYNLQGHLIKTFNKTSCIWRPDKGVCDGVYIIKAKIKEQIFFKRVIYLQ
jgi:predicted secreted hydrolase